MESTVVMPHPVELNNGHNMGFLVFNAEKMMEKEKLPEEFIWPEEDLVEAMGELEEPLVDMDGFMKGDKAATAHAAELIRKACLNHGFFQVINHGVDPELLTAAADYIDPFFNLPINRKLSFHKKPDEIWGYCGAHSDRFSSKLPWKEMITFGYHFEGESNREVTDYFKTTVGDDFERTGEVYQKYCEAMKGLTLRLMKLFAISLGLKDTSFYEKFFEDGIAILRCNYYPTCKESGNTLGVGPHCDPISITILHQDDVGGLEVFSNNKWYTVRPQPGSLVINVGDTLTALTNGIYRSCLHRAAVNSNRERKSWAYFVSPHDHKVVKPPEELVEREGSRNYPDFTWADLFWFTQFRYRVDDSTLDRFVEWLESGKPK